MKNINLFATCICVLFFQGLFGQVNSVRTWTLTKATTDANAIATFPVTDAQQVIQYYDDLGRLIQSVTKQGSPLQKDAVQYFKYDFVGREPIKYLPFVSTEATGAYKIDAATTQPAFYSNGTADKVVDDLKPFSETVFEQSPLNRVLKQGTSGADWQPDTDPNSTTDHTTKHHYETNGPTDVVQFTYDSNTGLVSAGSQIKYYSQGQLYANRTTDEHGNDVIEYTDKLGRTVCKKVQYKTDSNGVKLYASTYYIYDDLGNLVVVLPPEAVNKFISQQ